MRLEQGLTYQSFLLRLWRDSAERPWRASLLDPHTEQVRHFATVREMLHFLEEWSGEQGVNTVVSD
ncbi:MAG: hypothetical protein IPL28_11960 [Chloroflexi bacterium]|nr:hypothetical protein [Chloroflexota bacterium]